MFPRRGVPVWNVPEKCSRVRLYWEEGEERTTKYKPKGKPERLAFFGVLCGFAGAEYS